MVSWIHKNPLSYQCGYWMRQEILSGGTRRIEGTAPPLTACILSHPGWESGLDATCSRKYLSWCPLLLQTPSIVCKCQKKKDLISLKKFIHFPFYASFRIIFHRDEEAVVKHWTDRKHNEFLLITHWKSTWAALLCTSDVGVTGLRPEICKNPWRAEICKTQAIAFKKKKKKIKKEYVDLTNLQEEKMNVNAGKSPWT